MSDGTKIEWAEASWNPIRARRDSGGKVGWHCEMVSAGCSHCYAQAMNRRLGTGLVYNKVQRELVTTFIDDRVLDQPHRWRTPRRIFVCSMTDLFGEWISDDQIDRVVVNMAIARHHTFLVLTKRAERMLSVMRRLTETVRENCERFGMATTWPLRNVWLGVSVEDQERADKRIPLLLETPAAMRWVSYEPALGPVDFSAFLPDLGLRSRTTPEWKQGAALNWIVVGGESGPGARCFNLAWARATVQACAAVAVPCFVKQLGAQPVEECEACAQRGERWFGQPRCKLCFETGTSHVPLGDAKGGEMAEWPADLRVRKFPN